MAENLIGRTLLNGEYELREILGRGGMATVYRARSRSLETDVAVKVLAPRLAGQPGFRERFHDEARSLAQLHHPNLIEVHHYGEEGDLVYIVMRLVPSGTLKDRLTALEGPLDLVSTGRVIGQVADALQLAHDRGLVHLDIKPANVLLGRTDWPLLSDFGITRAIGQEETSRGHQRLAGTPLYMSPEQCQGGPVDGRSDQYSLAVTTFELLTGQWPFQGETTEALMHHHIADVPPHPRELNPGIPGPVEQVLLRGLAKTPEERYPTIRHFAADLGKAIEGARGITLSTKRAIASIAPNLLAVLVLVLVGPLVSALLPGGTLLGGRVPLDWPFKLLVALMIARAMLPIRWPVIGLATRALAGLLPDATPVRSGVASSPGQVPRWHRAIAGSVEGLANLVYLFALYALVAVPSLAIFSAIVDQQTSGLVSTAFAVIVLLAGVGIAIGLARTSGAALGVLALALVWAGFSVLPAPALGYLGGLALAWTAKAAVAALALIGLLATRGPARQFVRRIAMSVLGPMAVEARPGASPDEAAARRHRAGDIVVAGFDFVYLLVGYALLSSSLNEALAPWIGSLASALVVAGVAALVWLVLALRMRRASGSLGTVLAVLLGAPIAASLPVLSPSVVGADWPAVAVTWVLGIVVVLMLASARGDVQAVGRAAFGNRLERELLAGAPAPDEAQAVRRVGALGGVVGAVLDIGYLVIAFWLLGLPAARAVDQASGRPGSGSVLLALLVLASAVLFVVRMRRAAAVVAETGGPRWIERSAGFTVAAALFASLLVAGCSAAPGVLVAPATTGVIALEPIARATLGINWEYVLPWTPDSSHATYDIALSCSDGRLMGQYREAFPVSGVISSLGSGHRSARTDIPCDAWRTAYFDLRRAAGVGQSSSHSRDWLDVQVTLNSDATADVTENHRVLFTAGSFSNLTWDEGAADTAGTLREVEVWEGGRQYVLGDANSTATYRARLWEENGRQLIGWWFPAVDSPAERTFTIKYKLTGAIKPSHSLRFERTLIATNGQEPVWRSTAEVRVPAGSKVKEPESGAVGVPSRHGLLNESTVWFEARDVPAGSGFTIAVDYTEPPGVAPAATVSPAATVPATAMPATTTPAPTATATATQTEVPSPTATLQPTGAATDTATPAATGSGTPAASPAVTPAGTAATTPVPGLLAVPTTTPTVPVTPTALVTLTAQATPTNTPTAVSSPTSTVASSPTPTIALPTATPTTPPSPAATNTLVPPTATWTSVPKPTITPTPPRVIPPTATPTIPLRVVPPTPTNTPYPIYVLPPPILRLPPTPTPILLR